jgi:hypothetical protein
MLHLDGVTGAVSVAGKMDDLMNNKISKGAAPVALSGDAHSD